MHTDGGPAVDSLARAYFSLLAGALPACCLSDEFHTLPRAEDARFHLARADLLERDSLEDCCRRVREMRAALDPLARESPGTDAGLLGQSMDSFLFHWSVLRFWERDPSLYLKTAWIGLDLALRLPGLGHEEQAALYRARLRAIPELLARGEGELSGLTDPARDVALEMVETCRGLLAKLGDGALPGGLRAPQDEGGGLAGAIRQEAGRALESLDAFERFLRGVPAARRPVPGTELFRQALCEGMGWSGGLREALEVLEAEAAEAVSALKALARRLAPGQGWQAVYRRIALPAVGYRDPVSLYREEMRRQEGFFGGVDELPLPPRGSVHVEPTPPYLEPVRSTASYSAPMFAGASSQGGRFYVMGLERGGAEADRKSLLETEHRDYRYLTAHETLPGHHLLDWVRLHQKSRVRRQVESVLYYEGWACYAEQLLDECGTDPEPVQRLVRLRRNLWRAERGRIDAGLATGELSEEQAAARLEEIGSGSVQACRQARRITLTPGYQLCYTLGKQGFLDLRRRFVPPLTRKLFHETVLTSGQASFPLLARECAGRSPDRTP